MSPRPSNTEWSCDCPSPGRSLPADAVVVAGEHPVVWRRVDAHVLVLVIPGPCLREEQCGNEEAALQEEGSESEEL